MMKRLVLAAAVLLSSLLLVAPAAADVQDPYAVNAHLIALTVLYEAAGQPELGQRLVAHVVVNRAERSGTPYLEVVAFANGQFLGWTGSRKMAYLRCQVEEEGDWACFDRMALGYLGTVPDARGRWMDLLAMAMAVGGGTVPEPQGFEGAAYFDNPRFWPSGEPPWAWSKEWLGRVGDHEFWR